MGDPVELAVRYESEGADEIVFLDISAAPQGRRTLLDVVQRTAERLFIPLTVGGGVHGTDDIAMALRSGADKVSVNTAAVSRPEMIQEAAQRFGSQCVVVSIDARVEKREIELLARTAAVQSGTVEQIPVKRDWFRVFTHGGRTPTDLDAVTWAQRCAELGAGEILITSIDQDGQRGGYDLELTARIGEAVGIPVIASGGAGAPEHVRDAFLLAGADAALVAGIFHDGSSSIAQVKQLLQSAGLPVRTAEPMQA
jgi:cyclase